MGAFNAVTEYVLGLEGNHRLGTIIDLSRICSLRLGLEGNHRLGTIIHFFNPLSFWLGLEGNHRLGTIKKGIVCGSLCWGLRAITD